MSFPTFRYHYLNPQGLEGVLASGIRSGVLEDGQLLIGSTGAEAVKTNLTAGNGVTIVNEPGAVTVHASSVTPYQYHNNTPFTTSSTSDVLINGTESSPVSGDYLWTVILTYETSIDEETTFTLYRNNAPIADTEVSISPTKSKKHQVRIQQLLTSLTGVEQIDVRVRSITGTVVVHTSTTIIQKIL